MRLTGIRINGQDFEIAMDGKSAYELAKDHGFEGTEEEWLASLKGEQGPQGEPGEDGETPSVRTINGHRLTGAGDIDNIMEKIQEHALAFSQYTATRLRVKLTDPTIITDRTFISWNIDAYDIALNIQKDGTTVHDGGWKRTSPHSLTEAINGYEWDTIAVVLRRKDNTELTLDDLADANVLLYDSLGNELEDVKASLQDHEERIASNASEIGALKAAKGSKCGVTLIAHGGLEQLNPENTLAALYGAKKYGFTMSGADVRFTSDNVPILMHDATVDRTTDGTGNVADMTLEQIKALTIDKVPSCGTMPFDGLKVPTLEEWLVGCMACGIRPIFEVYTLTDAQADILLGLLNKYNLISAAIVECFTLATLQLLRGKHAGLRLAYLATSVSTAKVDDCVALGNTLIAPASYVENLDEIISYAHSKGVEIIVWTVNSHSVVAPLVEKGVQYIYTGQVIAYNEITAPYTVSRLEVAEEQTAGWGVSLTDAVLYKDVVRFSCDIFYEGTAKPKVTVSNHAVHVQDRPGEWQHITYTGVVWANAYNSVSGPATVEGLEVCKIRNIVLTHLKTS